MPEFDWRTACIDAERRYQELVREKAHLTRIATNLYNLAMANNDRSISDQEYENLYNIATFEYENHFYH